MDQVLDAGEVIEYEMPYILLQSNDGLFTKLVKQTGKHMTIKLKQMAKQYYSYKMNVNLEEEEREGEEEEDNEITEPKL